MKKYPLPLIKENKVIFGFCDYYALQAMYWKERHSRILVEHFSREEIRQLHSLAKKNGITMTSLFAGAILSVIDTKKKQRVKIGIPIDVRMNNIQRLMQNSELRKINLGLRSTI